MKKRWQVLTSIFALAVVLLGTTLFVAANHFVSASTTTAGDNWDGEQQPLQSSTL